MSLDSVALIVSIEKTFGISIPNAEAEMLATVQQIVDYVYEQIETQPNQKCLSQIVFYRIRKALEQFRNDKKDITPNTKMSEILSETNLASEWKRLEIKLQLKIPDLVDLDLNKTLNKEVKFFGLKLYDRTEPVAENTLRKLIDWIISMNFDKLISIEDISNKYEIERIVCAVVEDSTGVPVSEIKLHHSLTGDLGID
ncbi:MAG: phosphopantetheine-binding protein [Kordia sp.]|uniref:phosphopantetheine-binding protein n=1 Tax=Kordia sp. TaxID=1965332 RepID=UPI003858E57E